MNNNKDIILIVLYKRNEKTALSFVSFNTNCKKYFKNVKLVIWDNSPSQMINTKTIEEIEFECEYFHSKENLSLAKIYNTVVNNNSDYDSIFIFDQDSVLTEEYFEKMFTAKSLYKNINLFIPKIIHDKKVLSPAKRFLYKGRYYSSINPGIHSSKDLLCIASGMVVRTKCVKNYVQFDEKLSFYGIDSKFCFDFSKQFKEYFLIDYTLSHNLSKYETEDIKTKLWRLNNQNRAMLYLSRKISLISFLTCCLGCIRQYTKLLLKQL